jgi:hypothetical protein
MNVRCDLDNTALEMKKKRPQKFHLFGERLDV